MKNFTKSIIDSFKAIKLYLLQQSYEECSTMVRLIITSDADCINFRITPESLMDRQQIEARFSDHFVEDTEVVFIDHIIRSNSVLCQNV